MREGQKYVLLTYAIQKEDGQYAAECVELGTASCGDTFEEAEANLHEAVQLDLNTLEEFGERRQFFRDRGIRLRTYKRPATAPRRVNRLVPSNAWASQQRIPVSV